MTLSLLANSKNWTEPAPLPKVGDRHWNGVNAVGLVFLVMAVLQLISFKDFRDILQVMGLSSSGSWAVGVILAELWAGLSMMKVRLPQSFRMVGSGLAIVTAGFWLIENMQQVTGMHSLTSNSGYFSKYLMQSPGWWTIAEASVFLLCTLWAVDLLKNKKK